MASVPRSQSFPSVGEPAACAGCSAPFEAEWREGDVAKQVNHLNPSTTVIATPKGGSNPALELDGAG